MNDLEPAVVLENRRRHLRLDDSVLKKTVLSEKAEGNFSEYSL